MNIQEMLRQAQRLKAKIEQKQKELAAQTVEGSSGGGMVVVTATLGRDITAVKIEKEVVNPEDVEMLQDLIVAATNQALLRAKEAMDAEMQKVAPGIGGLPAGLL
ncbi:MAG: YbaB/EbfC family nucleoid-associated protein [Deltaproteobacteria bacterium]|nr:YbaB/EbfC family nucleoid-associated protein [Deltaproteobacteria bacterium]